LSNIELGLPSLLFAVSWFPLAGDDVMSGGVEEGSGGGDRSAFSARIECR